MIQATKTALSQIKTHSKSEILTVGWGVILLFTCSQISVPLEPVPITLQTMGVIFLGLVFSGKTAIRSVILYIVLGAAGIPLFANFSAGMQCLLGPSGGYIVGFVPSVYLLSLMNTIWRSNSWLNIFIKCLIGTAVIFIFGMFGLSLYVRSIEKILQLGLFPFIIPGITKAILLTLLLKSAGYPEHR